MMWISTVHVYTYQPPCAFDPESGTFPCLLNEHPGSQRPKRGVSPDVLGSAGSVNNQDVVLKHEPIGRDPNRDLLGDPGKDSSKPDGQSVGEEEVQATMKMSHAAADVGEPEEKGGEKDGVVEGAKGTNRLVVYSLHRSGSSFTGEIFGRHPRVFYMYEPFQLYPFKASNKQDHINRVGETHLRNVLHCNPKSLIDDVRSFPNSSSRVKSFAHRVFCQPYQVKKYKLKGTNKTISCDFNIPDLLKKRCESKAAVVTKLVTLKNFTSLVPLLKEGIKVVHLVRDPRGQILSIKKMGYKIDIYSKMSIVEIATHICTVLKQGIQQSSELLKLDPKVRANYRRVRIEDVMVNPIKYSQKLYEFVGLKETRDTISWLKFSTQFLKGPQVDAYKKVWSWRTRVPYDYVFIAEALCGDVLKTLGYHKAESLENLQNMNVSLHGVPADTLGWL